MAIYSDMAAIQFENANALRMYPFSEGSSLVGRDGKTLPGDIVADVRLVVPAAVDNPASGMATEGAASARLSSVHLSPYMVSACFAAVSGDRVGALSVTVSRDGFSPYMPYRLEELAGTSDMGGIVTFGDIEFPGFPETYFLDNAEIHPCCVVAARPSGLRRFLDPRSGEGVSGDAEIRFSGHVVSELVGNEFRLSLGEGSASALASECAKASGAEACGATPIRSINGVRPDAYGNIVLWFH